MKTVFDPEIPVNIWDMGLVYDIAIDDNAIKIEFGNQVTSIGTIFGYMGWWN